MLVNQQSGNVLKKGAYWILPQGFQSILKKMYLHFLLMRLPREVKTLFAKNKIFYNIHKGERCFILATGPSINKQELRPLKNEICIAVSSFFLHKDITEINPLYHVEAPNHAPYGWEVPGLCFGSKNRHYTERTVFFLGHRDYEFSYFNYFKQNPQIKTDNIYFLNYCYSQPLYEGNYTDPDIWDICKPLFGPRTVVYCAIQLAAYMGFKEIYLLGCDHDYLSSLDKGASVHFYRKEDGIDDTIENKHEWKEYGMTEYFFLAYYLRWKQYRLMKAYLESRGCYIYNATEGGMLDVFQRISLKEALGSKR